MVLVLVGNTGPNDVDAVLETLCLDFFWLFWHFLFFSLLCLERSSELELELDELLLVSVELSELELLEYFFCFFLDLAMVVSRK